MIRMRGIRKGAPLAARASGRGLGRISTFYKITIMSAIKESIDRATILGEQGVHHEISIISLTCGDWLLFVACGDTNQGGENNKMSFHECSLLSVSSSAVNCSR